MTCGLFKPVTPSAPGVADAQSKDAAVVQVTGVANESAPDPFVTKGRLALPSS